MDASTTGWGAVYEGREAVGHWQETIPSSQITRAEAEAVLLGLMSFANDLRGSWVSIRIDNVGAQVTMFKGGRRTWQKEIMRRIQTFCLHHDIWLFNAVHVASADNLADDPSREVDLADWSVSPDIFWMVSS